MAGAGGRSPDSTITSSGNDSKSNNNSRPRFFDRNVKDKCWEKADVVPGRHPDRWRKDTVGNIVCRRFWNCLGCLCYEYDHIVPYSKGGESTRENCQILQSRVNRYKSDKDGVGARVLEQYSCDIKFADREMDVIEMAVYGDVIRPGNKCRCRTVAEAVGLVGPKDSTSACELPYKQV